MKYFSMFSGIGGFEYGIEQANKLVEASANKNTESNKQKSKGCDGFGEYATCVGFSEIDKYAIAIYQRHFPNHKNYGDATKIDTRELPDFDFLCGGFPCQAFSIAGKRRGFDDTRGTLFFEIARILEAKRPSYFLLENVKGLLNHDKGKTFATIIQTLSELGYDVQWMVLNSKFFGVPQNRERVFIVGSIRGKSRPEILPFRENATEISGISENKEQIMNCIGTCFGRMGSSSEECEMFRRLNNAIYDRKGFDSRTNGFKESAESPTLSMKMGTGGNNVPMVVGSTQKHTGLMENQSTALTEAMGKGGGHIPMVTSFNAMKDDTAYVLQQTYNGFAFSDMESKRRTMAVNQNKLRRLTPIECERLQGFPDNWTAGVSDTQRYKCLGNAVTTNVITAIMSRWLENE